MTVQEKGWERGIKKGGSKGRQKDSQTTARAAGKGHVGYTGNGTSLSRLRLAQRAAKLAPTGCSCHVPGMSTHCCFPALQLCLEYHPAGVPRPFQSGKLLLIFPTSAQSSSPPSPTPQPALTSPSARFQRTVHSIPCHLPNCTACRHLHFICLLLFPYSSLLARYKGLNRLSNG